MAKKRSQSVEELEHNKVSAIWTISVCEKA